MSDQYYCFFPGDYLRDTGDLTLIEHGAYNILLHHYYTQERLPSDRTRLYRICRAFTQEEMDAINSVVNRFFYENGDGHIHNVRAEKEIMKRKAFTEAQSNRGRAGASARWGTKDKAQEMAQALLEHKHKDSQPSPSPSPSPLPKKQQPTKAPPELPEWVDRELWFDFLEHRNKLRKPMTRKAEEILIKKLKWLKEQGHNPKHLLMTAIERGWLTVFEPKDG